ncbi:hypothetical protein QYF61_003599 [Mycteria americana]|uniref:Uncharacterized protein n=1 Tax=Mycteria americana TaxID=33587 RepID=A0AAN7NSJ0_MYCAM|nr:hypothetical protein QYF61_003599 [Mycteria americana]
MFRCSIHVSPSLEQEAGLCPKEQAEGLCLTHSLLLRPLTLLRAQLAPAAWQPLDGQQRWVLSPLCSSRVVRDPADGVIHLRLLSKTGFIFRTGLLIKYARDVRNIPIGTRRDLQMSRLWQKQHQKRATPEGSGEDASRLTACRVFACAEAKGWPGTCRRTAAWTEALAVLWCNSWMRPLGDWAPWCAFEDHGETHNEHLDVVAESDEVSPQPPFLQAEQPQVPQPLPISLVLQTLPQLRCPSLDTLQPLNVSLVARGPTLNPAFEVRPHQCRVQGHDHCPTPAGHAIPDTSQDAIGFLGHLGTLLAHIQAAVDQHPQVLLCWAAFQPLFPKPVALHGVAVAHVQDLALGLVEPQTIDLSPWIQPVQVGHLVIGDQVGQAGPAFHEPMLAGPDPLVGLHMPVECTQDDLLHNFPRY